MRKHLPEGGTNFLSRIKSQKELDLLTAAADLLSQDIGKDVTNADLLNHVQDELKDLSQRLAEIEKNNPPPAPHTPKPDRWTQINQKFWVIKFGDGSLIHHLKKSKQA